MINSRKRLLRSEVPIEMTWDLSDLFESREEWEKAYNKLEAEFSELNIIKEHPFSNGKELYRYLKMISSFSVKISRIMSYTQLKVYEDYTNSDSQKDKIKAYALYEELLSIRTYLENLIIYKTETELDRLHSDERNLVKFNVYLSNLQKKKEHLLSPETELTFAKLYNLMQSPINIYSISKNSDLKYEPFLNEKGEELPNSLSLYNTNYELSPSYVIRGRAYQSLNKTLAKYKNTYAANFSTYVRKQVVISRLRNYNSATHMMLDKQNITVEMYENQINTVYTYLAPHMQRFAKLKQKVLGLKSLRFCDLKATISKESTYDLSYIKFKEIIVNALGVLGDDFKEFINNAFDKRWIDYADNYGKTYAGLCSDIWDLHPYVLFTMQNSFRSLAVLSHELGHAGVSFYRKNDLIPLNRINNFYMIEAPSTMCELLVGEYLINNSSNKAMKVSAILQLLESYYHNFVTHLLEAEFLKRIFMCAENNQSLTAKLLCDTKLNVLKGFWGKAVNIDDDASLTWMKQGHYYGNLRPFIYSAGQTVATNVLLQIKIDKQVGVERWKEFLTCHDNVQIDELLKIVDIDMTKPDSIINAVNYIGSLITELENLF